MLTRIHQDMKKGYIGEYDRDLATAVAEIGSTLTHLIIDQEPTYLTANLTVPPTLTLEWRAGCMIAGAFTLTINGGLIAGNYRLFFSDVTVEGLKTAYVEWWGAAAGDATDTGQYITKAQDSLTNGGFVKFGTVGPYKVTATNGVLGKSNITYEGVESYTAITHEGTITGEGNMWLQLEDVENVIVRKFRVTANAGTAHESIVLKGTISSVILEYLELINHHNLALSYGDADTSEATAYMNGVTLRHIRITGSCAAGISAGVNFFPRSRTVDAVNPDLDDLPASSDLVMEDLYIDVSNGSLDSTLHGEDGLKVNNVRGVVGHGITVVGGSADCIAIVNGAEDVGLTSIVTRAANNGIVVQGNHASYVDKPVKRVSISGWKHRNDAVSNSDNGLRVHRNVYGLTVANFDIDLDINLTGTGVGETISDLKIVNGVVEGNLDIDNTADNDIIGAVFANLTITGGAGTNKGRLRVDGTSRVISNSIFSNINFKESDNWALQNRGDDNIYSGIQIIDGNPDGDAAVAAIYDTGSRNTFKGIQLLGSSQNFDFFYNGNGVDGPRVKELSGLPATSEGVTISGSNANGLPTGDIVVASTELDLSAAGVDVLELYAAKDYYILGIGMIYTEASSADAGVIVRVGNAASSTHFLTKTSQTSQALGYVRKHIDSADFASRDLKQGEFLTVGTAGGKAGAGKVKFMIYLAESNI
jgi:hypothetical protein